MSVLKFHGARGSVPVGSETFDRYGGATICLSVDLGEGHFMVIDAGTGIRAFQRELPSDGKLKFSVLVTHYHWDHLLGLPFFGPLFDASSTFHFYGVEREGRSVEQAIGGVFEPPWFPLPLRDTPSTKVYVDIAENNPMIIGDVSVSSAELRHPQGVTAYRLDRGERSVVFATDVERGDPSSDAALRGLALQAEVLIHDAQYQPDEYDLHRGWGHSTWVDAVEAAEDADVGRLVLVSHDPHRTDEQVDTILAAARERFPNTEAAYAGMEIPL